MNAFTPHYSEEPEPAETAKSNIENGYFQWVPLAPAEDDGVGAHRAADESFGPQAPGADEFSGLQAPADASASLATGLAGRLAFALAGQSPGQCDTACADDNGIYRSPSGQQIALDPPRMADFLESLQVMGNVSIACARAGVSRQAAYRARRRSMAFARAWDAALLAARTVAETALAERAIDGIEETIYYHGEAVGSRRRYSDRLLLAHLGRLDKLAERVDVAATLPELDDMVDHLRAGEPLDEALDERAMAQARQEMDRGLQPGHGRYQQDSVTPVTPCPDCGGFCEDAKADPARALTEDDCQWLGNRLDRMDAARPAGALEPYQRPGGDPDQDIEAMQLRAFEAGEDEWWLLGMEDDAGGLGADGDEELAGGLEDWTAR